MIGYHVSVICSMLLVCRASLLPNTTTQWLACGLDESRLVAWVGCVGCVGLEVGGGQIFGLFAPQTARSRREPATGEPAGRTQRTHGVLVKFTN